jgi:hypothetical protein
MNDVASSGSVLPVSSDWRRELFRGRRTWSRRSPSLSLTPQALAMLTDGVDLRGGKLRPWYERGRKNNCQKIETFVCGRV